MRNIKSVLEDLGYSLLDRGNFWHANAVFRGGDNQTALRIYKDTGTWKDFVEDTPYIGFERLIEKTLNTKDKSVILKYLKGGGDHSWESDEGKRRNERIEMEKIYSNSEISKLLPHYKYYNNKGVGDSVLKYLLSGLDTGGSMYQRYVFPILNENKDIHGFAGRDLSIQSKSSRPKWKLMGGKNNWIYPYYFNSFESISVRDAILEKNEVILVESIGDLLSLLEAGIHNVLVSFGLNLSSKLICFLVELGLDKVVISFNNDSDKDQNRGLEASIKNYLKLLSYFDKDKLLICLPTKGDFGDMSTGEARSWLKKAESMDVNLQRESILKFVGNSSAFSKALRKNLKYLNNE
jgi:hypothetical protein